MRIMQVIPVFQLAGAETMCENLCIALKAMGHEVSAISLYTEHTAITQRLEEAGIRVIYLDKHPGVDFSIYKKLIGLFRKEKPDVVHTHIYASRYAQPAAILSGVTHRIHTVHNVAQREQTNIGKKINRLLFRFFHVTPVALSAEVQKTIYEVYGLAEPKVPVVLNGVNISKCIRKESYDNNQVFKVLHVGRFMAVKNHEAMLHALAKLSVKHPDIRMQFAGEGELLEPMKALARKLGVEEQAEFLGLQSNIYPFMHDADLFILPSVYEGMPMSIIEAMGTGLPIVASRVGGVPDMIEDAVSGLLCDPTVESIVEKVEEMMDQPKLREHCGRNALIAAERFSAEGMAERYCDIYRAY